MHNKLKWKKLRINRGQIALFVKNKEKCILLIVLGIIETFPMIYWRILLYHVLLLQSIRGPESFSVLLVVRTTHRGGSSSVNTVVNPVSNMRMVRGGSLICPQSEKYMLCTFRKKSSTRNPWPLHQDFLARLSTQSFSSLYKLQKNIREMAIWMLKGKHNIWISGLKWPKIREL